MGEGSSVHKELLFCLFGGLSLIRRRVKECVVAHRVNFSLVVQGAQGVPVEGRPWLAGGKDCHPSFVVRILTRVDSWHHKGLLHKQEGFVKNSYGCEKKNHFIVVESVEIESDGGWYLGENHKKLERAALIEWFPIITIFMRSNSGGQGWARDGLTCGNCHIRATISCLSRREVGTRVSSVKLVPE